MPFHFSCLKSTGILCLMSFFFLRAETAAGAVFDSASSDSTVIEWPCTPPPICQPPPGDFRTQTMGGWGTTCKGNNPGCFRDTFFDTSFPDGLTLGCEDGESLLFTQSSAIEAFLPCGGPGQVLSSSETDPDCLDNVFAGQLLAASLNLGFDATNNDFGTSDSSLAHLVFLDTSFAGYTVGELIAEAHEVFGGCADGDPSFYVTGLTQINEDFVDGNTSNGNLLYKNCTGDTCSCWIHCPEDVELFCGDDTSADITGMPSISGDCCLASGHDTCGVSIQWTYEDSLGDPGCIQTISRTFTGAIVAASGTYWPGGDTVITCHQTLTVRDTLAPVVTITCPMDVTLESDSTCSVNGHPDETGHAQAHIADNCDPDPQLDSITYVDHDTTFTDGADAGCYSFIRTWTASGRDWCDSTDMTSCDQIITVVDLLPPSIHVEDMDADCGPNYAEYTHDDWATLGGATASDNCDAHVTAHVSNVTFHDDSCYGFYTLHWSASDDCGNSSTAEQTINILDNHPPTVHLTCPDSITVESDSNCSALTSPGATGTADVTYGDNCAVADSFLTYADEVTHVFGAGCYTIERNWAAGATDACGHFTTDNCTQIITVVDLIPPTIHAADTTFECEPGNNFYPDLTLAEWATLVESSASDNCDENVHPQLVSVEMTQDSCTSTYVLTWEAEDECGNLSTAHQTVDVTDDEAPELEIVCAADITLTSDENCHVELPMDPPTYTVLDCDSAVDVHISGPSHVTHPDLTNSDDDDHEGCYTVVQTWTVTATDWCGLSTTKTCDRSIHVVDLTPPTFTGDTTINISCEMWPAYQDSILVTAEDNCDGHVSITMQQDTVSGTCPFSYFRTYHAVDDCGNMATFNQLINVTDDAPPAIAITCPDSATVASDMACLADISPDNTGSATAFISDNCDPNPTLTSIHHVDGAPTYSDQGDDDTPEGCYTFLRTWTAAGEDWCQNEAEASCTQVITVIDPMPPVFNSHPESLTLGCDESYDVPLPVAEDNCDTDVNQSCSNEIVYTLDGCETCYVDTWTCTAHDDCGNSSTISWSYTITDTDAPVITVACPGDVTLYKDANCHVDLPNDEPAYTVTDCDLNADVTVELVETITDDLTYSDDANHEGCYSILQTWTITATDCKSNTSTATCSRTITVMDNIAPEFGYTPESLNLDCYDTYDVAIPVATDNCDTDVNQSCDNEIVYTLDGCETCYVDTWTCTAHDDCGNSTSISWSYTITDTEAPVISVACPGDVTLYKDENCHVDLPNEDPAYNVTDCDLNAEVTVDLVETITDDLTNSDDDNHEGCYSILQTWTITATDCKNNTSTATCSRTVTVMDSIAPDFGTPPADAEYSCHDTWDVGIPVASDNCDSEVEQSCDYEETYAFGEDCPYEYTQEWTCTAQDDCGNSSSISWTITVVDDEGPECYCEDITVCCPTEVPLPMDPECMDHCDPNPSVYLMDADTLWDADCPTQGVIYRYWLASDCSGNETMCTQTITIEDDQAPMFEYTCGFTDGEVIEICCETATEQDFLSYQCDMTWTDPGCNDDYVIYEYTSSLDFNGDELTGCTASTPEAYENGETCTGFTPHALRLFNLPSGDKYFGLDAPGIITYIGDSAWSYSASFYVIDEATGEQSSSDGFSIDVLFDEGLDWEHWSDQDFPTGYKADCPLIGDNHEEWMYYLLSSGTLTGMGEYHGSSFSLTHQPSNLFYACQVGDGANNSNGNYGFSSWMTLSGDYVYLGQSSSFTGSGDIFGDLDCCPGGSYTQTVTLHDCGCNTNSLTWTVLATSDGCEVIAEQTGGNAEEVDVSVIGGDSNPVENKFPISVLEVAPNPTQNATQVQFISSAAVRLHMDLIQMDGTVVMNLFNGDVHPDMIYTQNLLLSQFDAGMYQLRWSTNQGTITKKVLLTN